MTDRQISIETLVATYKDELAMQAQRIVEQTAYARALETANAELVEKVREYEAKEQEASDAPPDLSDQEAKAQQNGKAPKARSR